MNTPPGAVVETRVTRKEEEVEQGTDTLVQACLREFKNMWTKDAWSHKTVSKGLSWKWQRKPPLFRAFFQRSD